MSVMANSARREAMILSSNPVEEAVRTILYTYRRRKAVPSAHQSTNSEVSEHEHTKPVEVMKVVKPA